MNVVKPLGLALAFVAVGAGAGAMKWRGSAEQFHREARMAAILDQAAQMPSGGVLVIGDSTAEFNRFDTLCGLPALNAGIAWTTAGDWIADAPAVVKAARPSIVVLALGSNTESNWRESYRTLANLSDAKIGVAPRDAQATAYIRTILTVADGAGSYRDDKHPDASGAAQWRESINKACEAL